MKNITFNSLIPELSVSDIERSKKFYLELGFTLRYERIEDKFCFLELENNQIMIQQINEHWNTGVLEYPFGRGINLSMEVIDIMPIYQSVRENNYPIFREIMKNSYQIGDEVSVDKEFLIQDPDGYLLRFVEA